jgi:hypothetical protein
MGFGTNYINVKLVQLELRDDTARLPNPAWILQLTGWRRSHY